MKKIISFVMVLSCTIAAVAQMSFNVATSEANDQNAGLMVRPFSQSHVSNADMVLEFDPSYRAQFEEAYRSSEFYFDTKTATRKVALEGPVTNTVDSVFAYYLTNYYLNVLGQSTNPIWSFSVTTTGQAKYGFTVQGLSNNKIACSYAIDGKKNSGIYVSENNDTLNLTAGMFKIAVDATVNNKPTYFFSGNFTDEKGNTHTLQVNPTAYVFQDSTAVDMFYLFACSATKQASYCNLVNIVLADKKIDPSGQKYDVKIANNAFVRRTPSGFIVAAKDNETYFQTFLRNTNSTPDGEYVADSIDLVQTMFVEFEEKNSKIDTTYHNIYQCLNATVKTTAEGYDYLVSVLDTAGDQYNFTFSDTIRIITETINVSSAYGNYYDYTKSEGVFRAVGKSGDSLQVSFAVYTDNIIGQYTTMDSYADGGYNYVLLKRNSGVYQAKIDTITIEAAKGTEAATYDYIATIKYLAQNANDAKDVKWFKIRFGLMSFYYRDQANNVEQTYDISAGDKATINTNYYSNYGLIAVQFTKADASDVLYAQVFTTQLDQTNILPVGEYPVTNTGSFPSVYASSGCNELSGAVYPTFYGTLTQGKVSKMWFVVDGKMTVETGTWTLQGLNSKGYSVTINIKLPSTGLDNATADNASSAVKMIRNGQLLIQKNGKLYNAQGVEVTE